MYSRDFLSRFRQLRGGKTSEILTEPAHTSPIYLISMAGFPNFGDELIAHRWLSFLAEHCPEREVWLDVREPGTVVSLLRGIHPKLHVTNTLFRAIHEHLHGVNRPPAKLVKELGSPKFDLGLLELRRAGIIHLLGGGFVNAVWPHHTLITDAMRAAKEISGAYLAATGQGLMPRVDENFENFDYVSVRDTPSALALGIERGFDDAYLVSQLPQYRQDVPLEEPNLYLCIQNDALDEGAHTRLVDFTVRQVKEFDIPRERTFYVEAIPGDDYAGYDALREYVAEDGFIPFAHFWQSNFSFDAQQIWVTSRFHHHLVGSLHGARGIALSGMAGYYDVKHGSLADTGTNWILPTSLDSLYSLEDLKFPSSFEKQVQAKQEEARKIYDI